MFLEPIIAIIVLGFFSYPLAMLLADFFRINYEFDNRRFMFADKNGKKHKSDWIIFFLVLFIVLGGLYEFSKYKEQKAQTQCIIIKASDGGEAIYEKVK